MLVLIASGVRIAEIRAIVITVVMHVAARWWLLNTIEMIGCDARIVVAVNRDAGAGRIDRVVVGHGRTCPAVIWAVVRAITVAAPVHTP